MTLRVGLQIDGDAAGAKRAAVEAVRAIESVDAAGRRTSAATASSAGTASQALRDMATEYAQLGRQAAGADSAVLKLVDTSLKVYGKMREAGDAFAATQQKAAEGQARGWGTVLTWGTRVLGVIGLISAAYEAVKLVASAFGEKAASDEEDVKKLLQEHAELVQMVDRYYGRAADSAHRFALESRALAQFEVDQARERVSAELDSRLGTARSALRQPATTLREQREFGALRSRGLRDQSASRYLQPLKEEFEPFADAISKLSEGGENAVRQFIDTIARMANEDDDLKEAAQTLVEMVKPIAALEEALARLGQQFDKLSDPVKTFEAGARRLIDMAPQRNRGEIAARRRADVDEEVAALRRQIERLPADQQDAAAARLDRWRRNAIATISDQTNAYGQLTQRLRDNIDEMNAEIAAGDKGTEAVKRLRLERELERAAKKAGVAVDREQIEALAAEAAATEKLLAVSRLRSDIRFDRATLGLSDSERAIAERLRPLHGGNVEAALASPEAALMRMNDTLRLTSSLISEGVVGGLQEMRDKLKAGELSWKSMGDIALNQLDRIAGKLMDQAADNLVKRLLGSAFGAIGGGSVDKGIFTGNGILGVAPFAAPQFHGGRNPLDPQPSGYRMMHPAAFATAPRFHSGREIAAVITDDEWVLKPQQLKRALGMAAAQGPRGGRTGGNLNLNLSVTVAGTGDQELMTNMQAGARAAVQEALAEYDRHVLPARIADISDRPDRR